MFDVRISAPGELVRDHTAARNRLERQRADEPPSRPRHDRHDLVAARLQTSGDLDRLIRTDAAGHAEGNQGHVLRSLLGFRDSPVPSS